MTYDRNAKIELILDYNPWYDFRTVYYRIVPSELPLLQRLFFNQTKQVYHSYTHREGVCYLFDKKEYYELARKVKTYGDMCDYLAEEQVKIDKLNALRREELKKLISEEKEWPDVDDIDEL